MNMDVQFLGYGVFIAVIIGLIMGFPSWQIRLVEAIIVVASGVHHIEDGENVRPLATGSKTNVGGLL